MFKKGDKVVCVNTEGNARGVLNTKEVYIVAQDERPGAYQVLIEGHPRPGHNPIWGSARFKLAPEGAIIGARPLAKKGDRLTKDNAKVGMKVLAGGVTYTIHKVHVDRVEITRYPDIKYEFHLFKLAEDEVAPVAVAVPAPPKAAGDKIVCIDGYRPAGLKKDRQYTIKTLHATTVLLEEIPGKLFSKKRFDFGEAVVAPPKEIEVGDMVYVVAHDDGMERAGLFWHTREMDTFIKDGIARKVVSIEGLKIYLANHYYFTKECLSHTPDGKTATATANPPKDDILAILRGKQGGRSGGTIVSFAIKRVGQEAAYHIDPACYAAINYSAGPIEQFVLDTTKHTSKNWNAAHVEKYLNYLLNDSPWAPCFTTKDVKEALDKGIVMDCNRPIGQLVGAGCAVREFIEKNVNQEIFQSLLEAGYHGNTVYLMSVCFSKKGSIYTTKQWGGHSALYTTIEKDDMLSFFLNGFPDKKMKAANAPGHTKYEVNACIGKDYGAKETFISWVTKETPAKVVGKGWEEVRTITKKSLFEFASKLELLVTKQEKK